MGIREILRQIRQGLSDRATDEAAGVNRKTVARYRAWASEQELLTGPLPPLGELHRLLAETMPRMPPPQNVSSVEPYRELVVKLRQQGVEMVAIHQRLRERGYGGSYSSVRRFVRNLEPLTPEVTVRVETPPGEDDGGKYDRTEKDFHVIDVFLRTPPRRLRLDERTLEITEQSSVAMNRRINIRMLGARLAGFAARTPANKALGLFPQRGSASTAWEEFTFDTEPAFDLYCRWLLAVNKGL